MKKTLEDIDQLQSQINLEWHNYRNAIIENKKHGEVQKIYFQIKELERQLDVLLKQANDLHPDE